MSNERMSLNDIQHALMKALYRPGSPVTSDETDAAMDALGGLVAAEADGRLLRLPCAFGTRVYEVYALRPDGLEELDRTLLWRRKKSCSSFCSTCEGGTCAFYDVKKGECQAKFDHEKTWHIRSVRFSPEHIREIAALCYEDIICLTREEAEAALKGRLHNEQTDAPES